MIGRAVLKICGSATGQDAIWVPQFLHMYSRYAESHNWTTELTASRSSDLGPPKEVNALIIGEGVYRKLKYENGVHRIQWVPPMELQGRVITSKMVVGVSPERDEPEAAGQLDDRAAETIRTYNIPLNRVTDHRAGITWQLDLIMDGKLDLIIDQLSGQGPEEDGII